MSVWESLLQVCVQKSTSCTLLNVVSEVYCIFFILRRPVSRKYSIFKDTHGKRDTCAANDPLATRLLVDWNTLLYLYDDELAATDIKSTCDKLFLLNYLYVYSCWDNHKYWTFRDGNEVHSLYSHLQGKIMPREWHPNSTGMYHDNYE